MIKDLDCVLGAARALSPPARAAAAASPTKRAMRWSICARSPRRPDCVARRRARTWRKSTWRKNTSGRRARRGP